MKISKKAVLTTGSAFMLAGLGLMFVSAADKDLFVDPNNAIQHFVQVKIIARDLSDNSSAVIHKQGKMIGIETDYNFILSQTGDNLNKINVGVRGSSILGGIKNVISGGKYNGILGGEANEIVTGTNNAILGGKSNSIFGKESVILGGEANEITSGSYSSIVGGNGNSVSRSYAVAVGENNEVVGYNSVAMGSGSKLMATSSFLWTDGNHSDELTGDHVFAVMGDNGMIVNTGKAHNLAQLTVGGSLVVYEDENAPVCNNETKGALKVITGDSYNKYQKCFCSCDGSGWNALHEGTRCATLCTNTYDEVNAECGGVELICTNPYTYTGSSSGACIQGKLLEGTGAFLLGSQIAGNSLVHYINRSCQAADGKVVSCKQEMTGDSCPNKFTMYYECLGEVPEHAIGTTTKPGDSATPWRYDLTGYIDELPCRYVCDEYSERDPLTEECVPYACTGTLEDGAELNNAEILPTNSTTKYEYDPDDYSNACKYHCTGDYHFDLAEKKCVLCTGGEVYDETDGKCKKACVQGAEFESITIIDDDGYAITVADRNLGATSNDVNDLTSFGCFYQWGNNCGFQPVGDITISTEKVDVSGYGPSAYNRCVYVTSPSCTDVECADSDWANNPNNNLWGGENDDISNRFGVNVSESQKKNRRGPCPEGWHVPSIGEWSDLLTIWYNSGHSDNRQYVKDTHKIQAFKNQEEFVLSFRNYFRLAPAGARSSIDASPDGLYQIGGSYWASSSPWKAGTLSSQSLNGDDRIAKFPSDAYSFDYSAGYIGNGVRGIKNSGQSVRCFKDVPECPSGTKWNQENLKCEDTNKCDIDITVKQDLEVFFISLTGSISHYTMMDRNLGATEAFNQNISSPNKKSYGCYFQWGNNYPFNAGRSGSSYTTGTLTDIENYGPGRLKGYYYNSKRHCYDGEHPMYPIKDASASIPANIRFWGGGQSDIYGKFTQTGGTDIDRQGPCPTGYHIPGGVEMENIMNDWKAISNYNESDTEAINLEKSKKMASDLLLPFAGWNGESCSKNENPGAGTLGKYFISDYYRFNNHHLHLGRTTDPDGIFLKGNGLSYGISIRCVKNNISANQKVTINANGGTKAVIAIDWETPNQGTIVTLGEPERTGYTFGGWYKDTKFTTKVDKGDKISSNGQLNAKWEENDYDLYFEDLDAYFVSATGSVSYVSMMDRNLGATSRDISATSSYGYHYQWGNNHGFESCYVRGCSTFPGGETTSDQKVDVSAYNNNPSTYSRDVYVTNNDNWMSSNAHANMWGGASDKAGNNRGLDIITYSNVTDRKGPCPVGYHVPAEGEFMRLLRYWVNAYVGAGMGNVTLKTDSWPLYFTNNAGATTRFQNDFNIPFAGGRKREDAKVAVAGIYANYWTSSASGVNSAWAMGFDVWGDNNQVYVKDGNRAYGQSVRCFRDAYLIPLSPVTVHPNGGTDCMILVEGSKVKSLGTPKREGYTFGGWYTNTGFTNRVNEGDTVSDGSHLYAKWTADDPGNGDDTVAKDLDVYFLKSDGSVAHDTLMDRNMGATEIYNQNYTNPNKASYGYHYQWGNNYGFPSEGDVTTSLFQVDASGYGPGRYYNNGMFISKQAGFYDWSSVQNDNLWGGSGDDRSNNWGYNTGNNMAINVAWRQGPCPAGYHVPSNGEWKGIYDNWNNANTVTTNTGRQWASDLLLPFAGNRSSKSAVLQGQGSYGYCWSSTAVPGEEGSEAFLLSFWTNGLSRQDRGHRAYGQSLRCFKNSDNSQVLTIHPNGGTNAVIAVDGNVITALGTPKRAGYTFGGWYTDSNYNYRVYKGDTISNESHLYAKWNNNTVVVGDTAMFETGSAFNSHLQEMGTILGKIAIVAFERAGSIPSGITTEVISAPESELPIYAWYDEANGGTIYYYTQAKKIYLNPDSSRMFMSMEKLVNIDMSGWDASIATGMDMMFMDCKELINLDLSSWDTSNVRTMMQMFTNCSNLARLNLGGKFNTSKVTDMRGMFLGCHSLVDFDLSQFDNFKTDNVTDMSNMFSSGPKLTCTSLSKFKTSKVTNMQGMFLGTPTENIDLSNFDTSKVNDMSYMFSNSDLESMDITSFTTSMVNKMDHMFADNSNLTTIYAEDFDIAELSDEASSEFMFKDDFALSTPYLDEPLKTCIEMAGNSTWNQQSCYKATHAHVSVVEDADPTDIRPNGYFTKKDGEYYCKGRDGKDENAAYLIPGPEINQFMSELASGDLSKITAFTKSDDAPSAGTPTKTISETGSWRTVIIWYDNGTIYYNVDTDTSSSYMMRPGSWKMYFNKDSSQMFSGMYNLENMDDSDKGYWHWDTRNVEDMNSMFKNCESLNDIQFLEKWDVSNVTNMSSMFEGCLDLSDITPLENWGNKTKSVTNMSSMFKDCKSLNDNGDFLSLNIWDVSKVTNMSSMFEGCSNLENVISLDNWDVSKVTNMSSMFKGTRLNDIPSLSEWNISSVRDMSSMFEGSSLGDISPLNDWGDKTKNVTNMSSMFKSCRELEEVVDLGNWNTANVRDMSYMFAGCSKLKEVDLGNWNTANVRDMSYMFSSVGACSANNSIDVLNLPWNTANVTNMEGMFNNPNIKTLKLCTWDTSNVTDMKEMFKTDSTCGYRLTKILASDKFNTNRVSTSSDMFLNSLSLKGGNGTTYSSSFKDKTYARIDGRNGLSGYFTACDAPSAPKCRVDFDENGGIPDYPEREVDCGTEVIMPTVIRSGYDLLGWYYNGWTGKPGSGYTVTEDTLFRAGWNTGFYCVGEPPQNAVLITGSDEGLTGDIPNHVYEDATKASGKSCAYLCKQGFTYVENYDIPQCVKCVEGTYDASTKTCQVSVGCEQGGYVYGPSPSNPGGYACLRLGNCVYDGHFYTSVPDSNGKSVDFKDAQPVGIADGYRSCVEGTPSKYQCQYQCKDDFECINGVCESVCPSKDTMDVSLMYQPTWGWRTYNLVGNANYMKVGNGGTGWQHVDKLTDLNDSSPDGCYFECKEGTYYGTSVQLNGGVIGCLPMMCEPVTYYRPLIDTGITLTGGKPTSYMQKYEFVDDISAYMDEPGCYYSCDEQYRYRINAGGYRACMTGLPGITELCPSKPTEWRSYGLDNNANYRVVGKGGTGWQYTGKLADLNDSSPDGCYFECIEGTYYGAAPKHPGIVGCISFTGSCPETTSTSVNSSTYLRGTLGLDNNANYRVVGMGGIRWQYTGKLADLNDSSPDGCYFECKEGAYYQNHPTYAYVKGCIRNGCSSLPDYANDTSIVSTGGKQDKYYTGWTFVEDLSSYMDQNGCFYTCDEQYRYMTQSGAIGCKKDITDDDRCPSKKNSGPQGQPTYFWGLYNLVNNAYYRVVGAGGTGWKHVDKLSNLNDSSPDGCYFECKEGTYYGTHPDYYFIKGCIPKVCDSLPSYANNTSIVSTGGKPTSYKQGWEFRDNLNLYMNSPGCYYTCDEQYRYDVDGGVGCAYSDSDKCPEDPYYWNYPGNYGTYGVPAENKLIKGNGGDRWIYKENLNNISEENGCFYTCREGEVYSGYQWGMCQRKMCASLASYASGNITTTGGKPALYKQKWTFVTDISSYMNSNGCYYTCEMKYRYKAVQDGAVITKCGYKECDPGFILADNHECVAACPLQCDNCGWNSTVNGCTPNEQWYDLDCSKYGSGWHLVTTSETSVCAFCMGGTHWTGNGCVDD